MAVLTEATRTRKGAGWRYILLVALPCTAREVINNLWDADVVTRVLASFRALGWIRTGYEDSSTQLFSFRPCVLSPGRQNSLGLYPERYFPTRYDQLLIAASDHGSSKELET